MKHIETKQEIEWIKHRIQFLETENEFLGLLEKEVLELEELKKELESYEINN